MKKDIIYQMLKDNRTKNEIEFEGKKVTVISMIDKDIEDFIKIMKEKKNIDINILETQKIEYNLINTDFSNTCLNRYTLTEKKNQIFYILKETMCDIEGFGTTLYFFTEKIEDSKLLELVLFYDKERERLFQERMEKDANLYQSLTSVEKYFIDNYEIFNVLIYNCGTEYARISFDITDINRERAGIEREIKISLNRSDLSEMSAEELINEFEKKLIFENKDYIKKKSN